MKIVTSTKNTVFTCLRKFAHTLRQSIQLLTKDIQAIRRTERLRILPALLLHFSRVSAGLFGEASACIVYSDQLEAYPSAREEFFNGLFCAAPIPIIVYLYDSPDGHTVVQCFQAGKYTVIPIRVYVQKGNATCLSDG